MTNPHNGLRSFGSLRDNGRCRSLWCCSMSVRDHKRVCLSCIHLYLQWRHKTNTERKLLQVSSYWIQEHMTDKNNQWVLDYTDSVFYAQSNLGSHTSMNTHVSTRSERLNKEGFYSAARGEGVKHRSYLLLTGQLFEGGRGCVCVHACVNSCVHHNISLSQQTSINSKTHRSRHIHFLSFNLSFIGYVTCNNIY